MMLGQPHSSWEYLPQLPDEKLLGCLEHGHIPGLIAKEITEWVVVEILWSLVEAHAAKQTFPVFRGVPHTPLGVMHQCRVLLKQFAHFTDAIGVNLVKKIQDEFEPKVIELQNLHEIEHQRSGQIAFEIIRKAQRTASLKAAAFLDASNVFLIENYHDFNVCEKLRELINMHSRRSRYLY